MDNTNNEANVSMNVKQGTLKSVNNQDTQYEIDESQSQNINSSRLEKGEELRLFGNFYPIVTGKQKIIVKLQHAEEREAVELSTETTVIQVQLSAEILQPLPNKVALHSEHETVFLITNRSDLDATKITIDTGILLPESITIIEETVKGDGSIEVNATFTLKEFNTRAEEKRKLDTNKQFRITGKYKAETTGDQLLGVLVTYKESETLDDERARRGVSLNELVGGKTEVVDVQVKIEGQITIQLPDKMKFGDTAIASFIFTNKSLYPATNVNLFIAQKSDGETQKIVKKILN